MDPINLQVFFIDASLEPVTVSAIASDLIAFEAKFDLSVAKLSTEVRLTHLFFLAWHASKRTKSTQLEFDAWAETVSIVKEADSKK
jgi:hypothetical protein